MFTGIIEDIGKVINITSSTLHLDTNLSGIKKGDSVAVNGVCLTAVKIELRNVFFDYSPTTGGLTNISLLQKNSYVNLERALQLSSRLGGHIVSGHIDTAAKIVDIKKAGDFYFISFTIKDNMKDYIVQKGFIAVDGVSLTVAELSDDKFSVTMIPETFNKTIFHMRRNGDVVNIELDVLAKYIEKILNKKNNKNDITVEMLKENGFF